VSTTAADVLGPSALCRWPSYGRFQSRFQGINFQARETNFNVGRAQHLVLFGLNAGALTLTRHRDLPVDGIAASPARAVPRAIGLPQFRIGFSLCHPDTVLTRTEAGNNNVPSTVRRDPGGRS
jgi:hypothetical protein